MHCIKCGNKTELVVPDGDNKTRQVCTVCGHIHYVNPNIIVGILPVKEDKILLCKRAIEPGFGKWTLPSGFMEIGESLEQGAKREAKEEANLQVQILHLQTTYSLPKIGQVYMLYLGEIINDDFAPMDETLEVKLFSIQDVPWGNIAFSSVTFALEKYVDDYNNGVKNQCYSNY